VSEPKALIEARRLLALAESESTSAEGLAALEEGLALLDTVMATGPKTAREVATNLFHAYARRLFAYIEKTLGTPAVAPEPVLEHLFRLVRAFDRTDLELPSGARSLKVRLARALIERYCEGHGEAPRQEALRRLTQVTDDDGR
jgi:hypothetical protein